MLFYKKQGSRTIRRFTKKKEKQTLSKNRWTLLEEKKKEIEQKEDV